MAVTIPEELRLFVARGVASGRFRSEDEAIAEGLEMLRQRETKLDALREDIQLGVRQLDDGEKRGLNMDAIIERAQIQLDND